MPRPIASIGWWAMLAGIALFGVGIVAILAASIQGMQLEPGLTLVDGYWIGLLPWMEIGTWLAPIGAFLAAIAGAGLVMAPGRHPVVRLAGLALLGIVLFWILAIAYAMAARNGPDGRMYSSDFGSAVYSQPDQTVVLLLLPATAIVVLAVVARLRSR
jgi:hypothetical protein